MNIQIKDFDFVTLFGEQAATLIIKKIEDTLENYSKQIHSKEWLTIKEAAEYIGVSTNTFAKMRQMGLQVCEIEGIKRVSKTEIDRFLKSYSY